MKLKDLLKNNKKTLSTVQMKKVFMKVSSKKLSLILN